METRLEGNDVIFKTSHFSSFVIAEKATVNGTTVSPMLPETGAPISSNTIILIAIVLIGSGVALSAKKGFKRA